MYPRFIIAKDRAINLAHIVCANFSPAVPASSYYNSTLGQEVELAASQAWLLLTLNAPEIETEYDHEGNYRGVASQALTLKLWGDEAERAWGVIGLLEHATGEIEASYASS